MSRSASFVIAIIMYFKKIEKFDNLEMDYISNFSGGYIGTFFGGFISTLLMLLDIDLFKF